MKTVGYMGGTNPEVLTTLLIRGFETIPLSNSWDSHGKYVAHITRHDNLTMVVGWLHKFVPINKELVIEDALSPLRIYDIPIVFIVPKKLHKQANKILADKDIRYKLADPSDVTNAVLSLLETCSEVELEKL